VVAPLQISAFEALDLKLPSADTMPAGTAHLNRYKNILPTPRTRVHLEQVMHFRCMAIIISCIPSLKYVHVRRSFWFIGA
jgi:hypothetical protein